MRWPRITAALMVVLFAGVAAWFASTNDGNWLRATPIAAPAVEFRLIDGRVVELASLRGNVVLVDFWATSCAICIAELPYVASLAKELAPRGFEVIAVAMPYDRPDHVLHYVERSGLDLKFALDIQGELVTRLGPVNGTPTLLLIDRNGNIALRLEGPQQPDALRQAISQLLDPPASG